jgi:hypothetical protein
MTGVLWINQVDELLIAKAIQSHIQGSLATEVASSCVLRTEILIQIIEHNFSERKAGVNAVEI